MLIFVWQSLWVALTSCFQIFQSPLGQLAHQPFPDSKNLKNEYCVPGTGGKPYVLIHLILTTLSLTHTKCSKHEY